MQIEALPLWPGVSLTLLHETAGWRFSSWSTYVGGLPPPPQEECVKWFASAAEAAAHFRAICPRPEW